MANHYEQLRSDALSVPGCGDRAAGLALFVRNGMSAWMRAWLTCMPECAVETVQMSPGAGLGTSMIPRSPLSADVRGQITAILIGMVLSREREAQNELGSSPKSEC